MSALFRLLFRIRIQFRFVRITAYTSVPGTIISLNLTLSIFVHNGLHLIHARIKYTAWHNRLLFFAIGGRTTAATSASASTAFKNEESSRL